MATYGEPNYKFPTLARAVPNVTTGGTIMAPVDFELLKKQLEYDPEGIAVRGPKVLALIRRVERYEKALKTSAQCGLCPFCASTARVAIKEEPDSVGSAAIVCGDETSSKESIQAIEQVLKAAKNRFGG